ncbi:hypothetical protein BC831DRAFT_549035 [Entophlyctis helioformis]|nr:hypothetical protein BC831DRAFT_549035 [Entophlyctis helioformis]
MPPRQSSALERAQATLRSGRGVSAASVTASTATRGKASAAGGAVGRGYGSAPARGGYAKQSSVSGNIGNVELDDDSDDDFEFSSGDMDDSRSDAKQGGSGMRRGKSAAKDEPDSDEEELQAYLRSLSAAPAAPAAASTASKATSAAKGKAAAASTATKSAKTAATTSTAAAKPSAVAAATPAKASAGATSAASTYLKKPAPKPAPSATAATTAPLSKQPQPTTTTTPASLSLAGARRLGHSIGELESDSHSTNTVELEDDDEDENNLKLNIYLSGKRVSLVEAKSPRLSTSTEGLASARSSVAVPLQPTVSASAANGSSAPTARALPASGSVKFKDVADVESDSLDSSVGSDFEAFMGRRSDAAPPTSIKTPVVPQAAPAPVSVLPAAPISTATRPSVAPVAIAPLGPAAVLEADRPSANAAPPPFVVPHPAVAVAPIPAPAVPAAGTALGIQMRHDLHIPDDIHDDIHDDIEEEVIVEEDISHMSSPSLSRTSIAQSPRASLRHLPDATNPNDALIASVPPSARPSVSPRPFAEHAKLQSSPLAAGFAPHGPYGYPPDLAAYQPGAHQPTYAWPQVQPQPLPFPIAQQQIPQFMYPSYLWYQQQQQFAELQHQLHTQLPQASASTCAGTHACGCCKPVPQPVARSRGASRSDKRRNDENAALRKVVDDVLNEKRKDVRPQDALSAIYKLLDHAMQMPAPRSSTTAATTTSDRGKEEPADQQPVAKDGSLSPDLQSTSTRSCESGGSASGQQPPPPQQQQPQHHQQQHETRSDIPLQTTYPSLIIMDTFVRNHMELLEDFVRMNVQLVDSQSYRRMRYTTLSDTQAFIQSHRPPVMGLDEAVRRVREENGEIGLS